MISITFFKHVETRNEEEIVSTYAGTDIQIQEHCIIRRNKFDMGHGIVLSLVSTS